MENNVKFSDLVEYMEHKKRLHIEERNFLKENPDYQGKRHNECLKEQNKYILICDEIIKTLKKEESLL